MACIFELEVDAACGESELSSVAQDALMISHLQYLIKPVSGLAAKLKRDVDVCSCWHTFESEQLCSPKDLAAALAGKGYVATMHKSVGGGSGTAAFRNLRHTFITVTPAPEPGTCCGRQQAAGTNACAGLPALADTAEEVPAAAPLLVVDPHFACQFIVANPSPRYAALQQILPQTFVGTMDQLEHVVEWVCRELEWSFKQQGQPLPPWREHRSMLTKWQPRGTTVQQISVGPAGASPPASPTCGCCCKGGGAARAMAAAGAATAATAPGAAPSTGCNGWLSPSSVLPAGSPPQSPHCQGHGHHHHHTHHGSLEQAAAAAMACRPAAAHSSALQQVAGGGRQPLRPTSLLSRSLEAAGIRRSASAATTPRAGQSQPHADAHASKPSPADWMWWEPRVHVVRRSG